MDKDNAEAHLQDGKAIAAQLQSELRNSVSRAFASRRPILTHLNADTTWLLQIPYPTEEAPVGRPYYSIVIDPWLVGGQSDVAGWFSQQWHASESIVKTISEVEDLISEVQEIASVADVRHSSKTKQRHHNGKTWTSCIDAVIVSHEFSDHCHKDTLLEVNREVPVYATKKAAALIRSWSHFTLVHETPSFHGVGADWRNTSINPLPTWLGVARIAYGGPDLLYYHSAILLTFNTLSSPVSEMTGGNAAAEAVIYTPHGIDPELLHDLPTADPPIQCLALLHGLHDISIGSQLNLGAHNGLKAQRLLKAKHWVGTHDEVKRGGGLVSFFLNRKVLTLQEALTQEKEEKGSVSDESDLADMREVRFAELKTGESLMLD
ncbi:MAG: hypothetical protein M1827_001322 [Pycnora praestabilis]|nr:MAG: hypothetical protein M1827_001322 [Pycnora praestabilis]